jgi:hypothetical protein
MCRSQQAQPMVVPKVSATLPMMERLWKHGCEHPS